MTSFPNLAGAGAASWIDVGVATFSPASAWGQGTYSVTDTTTIVPSGGSISLSSTRPTVLWITVFIPRDQVTPGASTATITLTPSGGSAILIPISLYIYNFKLKSTPAFATYLMSLPTVTVYQLDQMDAWKKVFLQHRMSPVAGDWPNGLSPNVGWDCTKKTLVDADPATSTESCIWANGCTMRRYIQGKGTTWRGTTYADWIDDGFPIYNPVRTDNSRPNICGISCGGDGWRCSQQYEDEWGRYLLALSNFLESTNVTRQGSTPHIKGFWYTQNEPQNDAQYQISAYLCSMSRKYAPKLSIMLTREAQPAIAERPEYNNCSYDIWTAHTWRYTAAYTRHRQYIYGEVSWFYSLDTDNVCASPGVCGPSFSPAISKTGSNGAEDPVATNDGPHYRVIPWVAWANRITGWGYYKDSIFWDTSAPAPAPSRPRISAALLREGFEDYEYLYIANGDKHPRVHTKELIDDTAMSIGYAVGVWERDPSVIHAVRDALGRKIEGSRPDYPYTQTTPNRAPSNYYINFQDTSAGPVSDFSFGGVTWQAIGWDAYNVSKGYGWNSMYMGLPNTIQTGNPILRCVNTGLGNRLEQDICYDDYNAPDEFHYALSPGIYNVSVAVGWPTRCRGDREYISVNNVVLRDFNCGTACCSGVREYCGHVTVHAGANGAGIIMTMGSKLGYTILNYMRIEYVNSGSGSISASSSSSSLAATTTAAFNEATTSANANYVSTSTAASAAQQSAAVSSSTSAAAASTAASFTTSTTNAARSSTTAAAVTTSNNAASTTSNNAATTTSRNTATTTSSLYSTTSTAAQRSTSTSVAAVTSTTAVVATSTSNNAAVVTSTNANSAATTTSAAAAARSTSTSAAAVAVTSTNQLATLTSANAAATANAVASTTSNNAVSTTTTSNVASTTSQRSTTTTAAAATSTNSATTSSSNTATTTSAATTANNARDTTSINALTTSASASTTTAVSATTSTNNVATTSTNNVATTTSAANQVATASASRSTSTTAAAGVAASTSANLASTTSSAMMTSTSARSTSTTNAVFVSTSSSSHRATTTAAAAAATTTSTSSTTTTTTGGSSLSPLLSGTVIGSSGSHANSGNTIFKAYDSNLATYYDAATASASWAGLNLGSSATIKQIQYAARNGYAGRMQGGTFQASNSESFRPANRVVTLFTIPSNSKVPVGSFATQTITISGSYQFVRYYGPNGGYCNVAEIAFRGIRSTTTSVATTMSNPSINRRSISSNSTIVPDFDTDAYAASVALALGVDPSTVYSIAELIQDVRRAVQFRVITTITSEGVFNSTVLTDQLIVAVSDPSVQTFLSSSGVQQIGTPEEVEAPNPAPATGEVATLTPDQAAPHLDDGTDDGNPLNTAAGDDTSSPYGPLTLASLIGIVVGGAVAVIIVVVVVIVVVKKRKSSSSKSINMSIF
eukprot:TRINITY_DN4527_c0_g1_i4.p1 TRINITY_DN4527_c0_g1~~TRINITY_DN4527_c0_g1_i4.p1  ORF type:complete len:1544 (-),score=244.84 TRINITY_DN4527_c0_g1_i4:48-4322(-)